MKKIFFCACLVMAASVWATQPENVVRAYMGQKGGYVLVDANNEVIGMSDNNRATALSEGLLRYMETMGKTIEVIPQDCPQEIQMPSFAQAKDSVGPLLGDIAYDQGNQHGYYNILTPKVGNEHCVTGCVATAIAQILAYHKWPDVCADTVVSYQTKTLGFNMTFDYRGCAFDWDNVLPNYYTVETTPVQDTAVAKLMLACGVAVNMNYTTESSGAFSPKVPGVLTRIFKYKKGLKFQMRGSDLTNAEYAQALKREFDNGRPVYCSATTTEAGLDGGHAFVIDGYMTTNASDHRTFFYHYNWGWGGLSNAWLKVNDANNPYQSQIQVVTGIEPDRATPVDEVAADARVQDGRIYDMMGRVVSNPVAGQIYIQNGVKFIAR